MTDDLVHVFVFCFFPHSFQFVIDDFMTLLRLFMCCIPLLTIAPGNERNVSRCCRSGKVKVLSDSLTL